MTVTGAAVTDRFPAIFTGVTLHRDPEQWGFKSRTNCESGCHDSLFTKQEAIQRHAGAGRECDKRV